MVRRVIATVVSSVTPPPLSAKDENARQMASAATQTANGAQQAAQQAEDAAAAASAAAAAVQESASTMIGAAQQTAAQAASTAASAAVAAQDAANAANQAAASASAAINHSNQVRTELEQQLAQMTSQVEQMASAPSPTNGSDGKSVEMRATASAIQWRREGGSWADLVGFASLKGADGAPGTANLQLRLTNASVTAILLGGNVDVPVAWSSPMPDADYQVHLAPQAGLLGRSTMTVKSKTREGCVINVASTSLAISAGSVLTVLALDF